MEKYKQWCDRYPILPTQVEVCELMVSKMHYLLWCIERDSSKLFNVHFHHTYNCPACVDACFDCLRCILNVDNAEQTFDGLLCLRDYTDKYLNAAADFIQGPVDPQIVSTLREYIELRLKVWEALLETKKKEVKQDETNTRTDQSTS